MGWINRTFLVLNGLLFAALLMLIDAQGASLLRPGDWEYKDLVSVMLTTVGVIVTFIGIIVAVAAIWGYQSITSIAEKKAEETSKAGSDVYLQSAAFQTRLDAVILERMENIRKESVQTELGASVLVSDASGAPDEGDKQWQD
jgi:uncharacterized membrane protein YidH (DUF202 family)